ncbi:hypothetical protein F4780DRAFT_798391 [Xylariomycetidae sp. FL0641]|nr:hypothetical protein F4780DRAFT_798391 [Xylariomycetidae sp. FL0641]
MLRSLTLSFSSGITFTAIATVSCLLTRTRADVPLYTDLESFQDGALGAEPKQEFFSSPIKAPIYQVNKFDWDKIDQTPYIFITGAYDLYGPSIISSKDLSLIWADQNYLESQCARTYDFHGETVLGVNAGSAVQIYNQHYELLYRVVPQGDLFGEKPDSHEALITDEGTVAMIVATVENADLRPVGGSEDEPYLNTYAQEVDPVTNEVLFQFNAADHFAFEDNYWPYNGDGPFHFDVPYDAWHFNSIEKTPQGDFLMSFRHLHAIILVDGATAQIKWILGGKRSQFADITPPDSGFGRAGASFHWQHNARFSGADRITLFDNHGIHNGYCRNTSSSSSSSPFSSDGDDEDAACSRGLELQLDLAAMTVRAVAQWRHPAGLLSASRGGVQRATPRAGHALVAWGQNPAYTEHAPGGEVVMDVQRGQVGLRLDHGVAGVVAYRAWKADWVGRPRWPPAIAAVRHHGDDPAAGNRTAVYVSWNGATEVAEYALLVADNLTGLNGGDAVASRAPRAGFETGFLLPAAAADSAAFARVAALDAAGRILGSTAAVDTATGALFELAYPVDDVTTSARALAVLAAARADLPAAAVAAVVLAVGFTV